MLYAERVRVLLGVTPFELALVVGLAYVLADVIGVLLGWHTLEP